MPSPRKGGAVPIRRGRKFRGLGTCTWSETSPSPQHRRGNHLSPCSVESDSSWVDTSDTSLNSSESSSPRRSRTLSTASSSSSSGSSSSSSDSSSSSSGSSSSSSGSSSSSVSSSSSGSDGDESDDSDDDECVGEGGASVRLREIVKRRGRSSSRRGARQRGGSVVCRYCGRRDYGAVKMVFSCCLKHAGEAAWQSSPEPSDSTPPGHQVDVGYATLSPSLTCTSPRYYWSPCSSDTGSSSSTLSDQSHGFDTSISSGEDADIECPPAPRLTHRLQIVHHGGHVTVN